MTGPRLIGLLLVVHVFFALLVAAFAVYGPLHPTGVTLGGVRYFADNFDRLSYLWRGQWALDGGLPYRDRYSDYPLLMTLYYGLPYFATHDLRLLMAFFPLANCLWLAGALTASLALAASQRTLLAFWLLPTTAYFVANRFDIIPVALVAGALLLLQRRRPLGSALLLALAINVKWYPLVLLLPCLAYLRATAAPRRVLAGYLLVLVAVTAALHAAGWLMAGGDSLQPYLFHHERPVEPASLYGALAFFFPATQPLLPLLTGASWLAAVLLPLLRPPRTMPALLAQSATVCILLIAGSRIHSPQWLLWYGSLAALCLATPRGMLLLAAVSFATYIRFPVLFDLTGTGAAYAGWSLFVWLLSFLLLAELLRHCPPPPPAGSAVSARA